MFKLIAELLILGLVVLIGAYIVPGVYVKDFGSAMIAAILIALVNASLGFVLRILTFPVNFLTLGLVSFVITVCMILLVSRYMDGFQVAGFLTAAIFAIVTAVLKMAMRAVIS